MVVILLGNKTFAYNEYNIQQWVANIPFECKTIVLFERSPNAKQLMEIGHYLATKVLWNVVLIATNIDAVYAFHYAPLRILNYTGYPDSDVLFFDRLKTLQTRQLYAAYRKDAYTETGCENIPGEDLTLFQTFADTLNLDLHSEAVRCTKNETPIVCFSRYTDKDFLINRLFFDYYIKFTVACMQMEQITIATPKGRLLTIWEILLQPLQKPVWWLIIAICIGFNLLEIVRPAWFSNNLVSLALFGFEKRQLRFTGCTEKMTTTALIVLFFLLKCAYEAKLISYITETPRDPGAFSIEALHNRNITVYQKHFNATHFNKLEGLLATYDGNSIAFDGLTLMDNRIALSIGMIVNEIEGIPYNILEENVYEMLPFYIFQPKLFVRQSFLKYQHRVFEAGLALHWRQQMVSCYRSRVNILKLKTQAKQARNVVQGTNLKPLVMFFSVQWVIAIVVFVVEVTVWASFKHQH
ncbi:uncharacterized protein LOC128717953 [Anopheles marshallii]|uniref:uncharacterized protein LOC128717953 n=1 Tax=Anopheles marshallii TaxID=1521116 RepID=UPI00237C5065|nr:uncharacterized protein LOC128717953 [Anopheles marshallii]